MATCRKAHRRWDRANSTLTRAAGLVVEARQDFEGLSKALEGKIAGLQGKWAGPGGTAFFSLHQAWTEKQNA